MSKMMKKIAMVENLIANRPSGSATGSLPHSKGSSFTAVGRAGAISRGMPSSAPAIAAATTNTMRIGTYSIASRGRPSRRPRPRPASWRGTRSARAAPLPHGRSPSRGRAQIAHGVEDLAALLAQAQDDPGLGDERRRGTAGPPEELERALVAAAVSRDLVEPRHRLDIVVEDIRPGLDHGRQRGAIALEIGDQQLHPAADGVPADGPHGGGEVRGAAVGEVVAVHGCDHYVLEPELSHRAADTLRLLTILPHRLAVGHRTVPAVARAHVAQDHEGRGQVLPALADIGTMRFLAYRMEVPLPHQALEPQVLRAARRADLQPRRLGRVGGARRIEKGERKSHQFLSFSRLAQLIMA